MGIVMMVGTVRGGTVMPGNVGKGTVTGGSVPEGMLPPGRVVVDGVEIPGNVRPGSVGVLGVDSPDPPPGDVVPELEPGTVVADASPSGEPLRSRPAEAATCPSEVPDRVSRATFRRPDRMESGTIGRHGLRPEPEPIGSHLGWVQRRPGSRCSPASTPRRGPRPTRRLGHGWPSCPHVGHRSGRRMRRQVVEPIRFVASATPILDERTLAERTPYLADRTRSRNPRPMRAFSSNSNCHLIAGVHAHGDLLERSTWHDFPK